MNHSVFHFEGIICLNPSEGFTI